MTGYYAITAQVGVTNIGDGNAVVTYIYVNGAAYAVGSSTGASAGEDPRVSISTVAPVTVGQYIEVYTDASTTLTGTIGSINTFLSIHFVGV